MLDRMLDALARGGVRDVVVNAWHLADKIESHLADHKKPLVTVIRETDLLETGGAVANALPRLGNDAFFVANSDVVILDGVEPATRRLAAAWRDDEMDAILLLHRTVRAFGYDGSGDFTIAPDGRLTRRSERQIVPYLFAGIQILHPRLFENCPTGAFSLNLLYDKAQEAGRLYGVVHDGEWLHVGTPDALKAVERHLREIG
jgi:MurNAc alpha-1-phosphate uridylyltransferase